VEAPADLTLTALEALESEHELPNGPPGIALFGDEDEWVTVCLDMRLAHALLELGPSLVEVHRRPRKVAADVFAAEHRVEEREIARLVRSQAQSRRRDRE
jgi:hypothetical protein